MSHQAGPATAAAVTQSDSTRQVVPGARLSTVDGDITKVRRIEEFLGVPVPTEVQELAREDDRFLDQTALEDLMLERPPFFFIERAVTFADQTVLAVARMTVERCGGHFPNRPIVPLIELCKAMAQAGIILVSLKAAEHEAPIAIGSGNSKAIAKELIAAPADVLIKATLDTSRLKLHFVSGSAFVAGRKIGTLANIVYTLIPKTQLLGVQAAV